MKPPDRLELTDDLMAALVRSHRSAAVPAAPTSEILAKIESGAPHPLEDLAPPARAFRPVSRAKAWLAGALGVAAMSTAALVMQRPSPPSAFTAGGAGLVSAQPADSHPPAALPQPLPPSGRRADDVGDQMPAIASRHVESLPSVSIPSPRAVAPTNTSAAGIHAPHAPTSVASASSLRRELELVTAARQALRGGDGAACLASVDQYEQEFPSGQFSHEGNVMRIEALALLGNREKARRLSRAFLASNPKSPYADRVRSVLTRVEEP